MVKVRFLLPKDNSVRDAGKAISLLSVMVLVGIAFGVRKFQSPSRQDQTESKSPVVALSVGAVVSSIGQAVLAQHKLDYRLGEQIRLIGYDVNDDTFWAGDWVELKVYWYTTAPIQYGHASYMHISTGGPLLAQADKLNPADILTKVWPSTGYLHDDYVINLPTDMPAGEYQLLIRLYTCDTKHAGASGNGDGCE